MKERWKKIRYRFEWLGCELLARCIPLLPRRACVRLANGIGTAAFRFDKRGRAVSLANLEIVFGDRFTPSEREAIARKSYQNFARTMLDLFWTPRLNRENFREYIRVENFDRVLNPEATRNGSVTVAVHFGCFEWLFLGMGFHGHCGLGVTEPFKNPLLTGIFKRLREAGGHEMIGQDRSVVRMLKAVKRGGQVGLLVDLNLRPDQPSVIIDCFGMKSCVTFLHAILQRRTGAPVVPMESIPLPDGTCRAIVHAPLIFPDGATEIQIVQACWDFFERIILADPGRWMWAYKHWRYKPRGTTRAYPFYANESSKFEKLLRAQEAEIAGATGPS